MQSENRNDRIGGCAAIVTRHRFATRILARDDRIIDIVNIGLIKSINKQFCYV